MRLVHYIQKITSKVRRNFTPEDRYSIVQESLRNGHSEICRKYNLFPSLLRKWRQKYLSKGKEGLRDSYPRIDPKLRTLEEENGRLKRIVAKQALELEVKSELLKNTHRTPEKLALMTQYQQTTSRTQLCQWLDLPRSVSYYTPEQGCQGQNPVR
ncbi:transposase [Larkinella rosea]|uniref:transposase n=1 Tax=Larkinella rosea TaxID=2025312 RepID=UPI001E3C37BA|nr:transposase [Larkinella rosea]